MAYIVMVWQGYFARVRMHVCARACMHACMHTCVHVCIFVLVQMVAGGLLAASNSDARVFCVDTFEGSGEEHNAYEVIQSGTLQAAFEENIARFPTLAKYITAIRSRSVPAAERFDHSSVDLMYLDGDHSADAVSADLKAWIPRMRNGSRFCGHDFIKDMGTRVA